MASPNEKRQVMLGKLGKGRDQIFDSRFNLSALREIVRVARFDQLLTLTHMKPRFPKIITQISVRSRRRGHLVSRKVTPKKTVVAVLVSGWDKVDTVYRCDCYKNTLTRKLDVIYSIEGYVGFNGTFTLTEISKSAFHGAIRC